MSAIPASTQYGPFPPSAGLPPPSVVMVPCALYYHLVSLLDLVNGLTCAPNGEAYMTLVRAHYYCPPSGGAGTVGPPASRTAPEAVNVTVDEEAGGTSNAPIHPPTRSTSCFSYIASRDLPGSPESTKTSPREMAQGEDGSMHIPDKDV